MNDFCENVEWYSEFGLERSFFFMRVKMIIDKIHIISENRLEVSNTSPKSLSHGSSLCKGFRCFLVESLGGSS